jgi:hypothetical protein
MSIIGNLVKQSLLLKNRTVKEKGSNFEKQKTVLRKLLAKARHTQFGRAYDFDSILYAMDNDIAKA